MITALFTGLPVATATAVKLAVVMPKSQPKKSKQKIGLEK
jgi:hypothetical protein